MKKLFLSIIENDLLYWIFGIFAALYFLGHLFMALINAKV